MNEVTHDEEVVHLTEEEVRTDEVVGTITSVKPLVVFLSLALCNAVDAIETLAFGSVLVGYVNPSTGQRIDDDEQLSGFVTSAVFIGMLIGGIIAGRLADRYGRKPILLICMMTNGLGGLLSALSPNFPFGEEVYWLLSFRIVAGIGVGGSIPCAFSLIAEWSESYARGFNIGLLSFAWTLGSIFISLLAWVLLSPYDNSPTWPTFLILASLPAFIAFALVMYCVQDTDKKKEGNEEIRVLQIESSFTSGSMRMSFLLLAIIWFTLSFGSYGVSTWIGDVFFDLGYHDPFGVALLFSLSQLPGNLFAFLTVDRIAIGRRMILIFGIGISAFSAFLFDLQVSNDTITIASAGMFNCGTTIAWVGLSVASAEMFPYKNRSTALGFLAAFGRVGSITANLVNPFLFKQHSILKVAGIVLVVGALSSCGLQDRTGRDI